ncbi:MAG: putative metallopeptidase [Patescibacteria group bacterium]|nr:putative metallopeptidase [Patescibacteria group bacterium]
MALKVFKKKNALTIKRKRRGKSSKVCWEKAEDIQKRVDDLVDLLNLNWIDKERVFCFRSYSSKAKAYARIWGFSKIWQMALSEKPAYSLEVLSQHFDKLSELEQDKVLLHELSHIPRNFSGNLVPHYKKSGKCSFHSKVDQLFKYYISMKKDKKG